MSSDLNSSRWANTSRYRSNYRDNHGYTNRIPPSSSDAEISAFAALASEKPIQQPPLTSKPTYTSVPPPRIASSTKHTPIQTTPPSAVTTSRIADLQASQRLLRRLQWKANLLLISHTHATASPAHERSLAETQFKLDFFEFFVLLERVLVHLLACLHISVHRAPTISNGTTSHLDSGRNRSDSGASAADGKKTNIFATRGHIPIYNTHRFHAHLLETLDRPSNPLHPCLGIGDVRMYLGVAKDCRNKWKDVGERERASQRDHLDEPGHDFDPPPETYTVASLNLATMLPCLLQGLERAIAVVEEIVRELPEGVEGSVVMRGDGRMDLDVQERWEGVVMDGVGDVEMEWE